MDKVKLSRRSDLPLYAQLRDGIRDQIRGGILKPGERLPAVVEFSKTLDVTQATVIKAFAELSKEGHIESYVGRGTFVKASPPSPSQTHASPIASFTRSPVEPVDPEFTMAVRQLRVNTTRNLEALNVLSQRPGLIHLTAGIPDPSIAAPGILAKLAGEALQGGENAYRRYGHPQGMPELREALARRMDPSGTKISAEQILITSGSQQAVSILAQAALERNMRIACEVPCYTGMPNAFAAMGHWVESVPRDSRGPIPGRFRRFGGGRPTMFYLVPEMHNPMGTDIAPERREELVVWAQAENATIVADEIFHDLRFEAPAPPSLIEDVGIERTVVIGSLSKSFMCGLRVGWLLASAERVNSFLGLKRAMDISGPPLMQGIALALLGSGAYDEHLIKAREHYRIRRDVVLEALKRCMPENVTWTCPLGGFHLWVELPSGYSSIALYLLAIERGVVIAPGPQMDIDHRFVSSFRLSYGSVEPAKLRESVELLADAVTQLLKAPPNDPGLSGLGDFL